jgi:hypothetical protein
MNKGMIARIRNVLFPAFIWRFDHWMLLRAPMLWRTRVLHLLVLLSVAVIAVLPFIQSSITNPIEAADLASNTLSCWYWQLLGATSVLAVWVRSILRKSVGELAPHRHVVTVIAVAIGSYLWFVTPSFLASLKINAIKKVAIEKEVLGADSVILSQYGSWACVPSAVWDNMSELERLRLVLVRYYGKDRINPDQPIREYFKKEPVSDWRSQCNKELNFSLDKWSLAYDSTEAIQTIGDARGYNALVENLSHGNGDPSDNPFYYIWIGYYWWSAGAIGIGILTAILSYPRYVWRRTFGRR